MSAVPQALADLKVLEFGGYAAGPHIGKVLANYGASTIHVESRERPDGWQDVVSRAQQGALHQLQRRRALLEDDDRRSCGGFHGR